MISKKQLQHNLISTYATVKELIVAFNLLINSIEDLKSEIEEGFNMKNKKHPGFKTASKEIQKKEGVSKKKADAILATGARKASKKAKKANPKLNKVKDK